MEHYASKKDTIKALESLGFLQHSKEESGKHILLSSPKKDENCWPIVIAEVYKCHASHWCVSLEGGFQAPCVWNGPKADWDKSDTLTEFVDWLNKQHPGWR